MSRKEDLVGEEVHTDAQSTAPSRAQICRTCLDQTFVYDPMTKKLPGATSGIGQILTLCVPEVYLGVSKAPVICHNCLGYLTAIFKFRKTCITTESKIKNYLTIMHKNHTHIELEEVVDFMELKRCTKKRAAEVPKDANPFQFKITNVVSLHTPDNSSEVLATGATTPTTQQVIKSANKDSLPLVQTKAGKANKNKKKNQQNASGLNTSSYSIQPIVLQTSPAPYAGNSLVPKPDNVNMAQHKLSLLRTETGQLLLGYLLPTKVNPDPPNSTTTTTSTATETQPQVTVSNAQPKVLNSAASKVHTIQNNTSSSSTSASLVRLDMNAPRSGQASTSSKGDASLKADNNAVLQGFPVPGLVVTSSNSSTPSAVSIKVEPQSSDDSVHHKSTALASRMSNNASCNISTLQPPSNTLASNSNIPPSLVPINANNNPLPTLLLLSEPPKNVEETSETTLEPSAATSTPKPMCSSKHSVKHTGLKSHLDPSTTTVAPSSTDPPLTTVIKQEPTEWNDTVVSPSNDTTSQNDKLTTDSVESNIHSIENNPNNANIDVNRTHTKSVNVGDSSPQHVTIKEEPPEPVSDGVVSVKTEPISIDDTLHDLLKDIPAMEREDVPEYVKIKRIDHRFYASHSLNISQPPSVDVQPASTSHQLPKLVPHNLGDASKSNTKKNQKVATKRKRQLSPKSGKQKKHQVTCFWRDGYFVWDHDYSLGLPSQYTIDKSSVPIQSIPPPLVALSMSTSSEQPQVEETKQVDAPGTETAFHCFICSFETNKPFAGKKHLERHMGMEHEFGILRCPACLASFSSVHDLNQHCIIHCERCDVCGLTVQSWQMNKHQRLHKDKKSTNASNTEPSKQQQQPGETSTSLNAWERRKLGRKFVCGMCQKVFNNKRGLTAHVFNHKLPMKPSNHSRRSQRRRKQQL